MILHFKSPLPAQIHNPFLPLYFGKGEGIFVLETSQFWFISEIKQ